MGAIIVKKADPKLRHAVKANDRISLWEFDGRLEVRHVALPSGFVGPAR